MGARVDVRVHAQRHRGAHAQRARHRVQALELRLALDVEAADPRQERGADLLHGLAHAREDDAVGAPAGGEDARELPAGDDVEARPEAGEDAQHREVGVRLHRVAHEVVGAGERLVEGLPGRFDRGAGVDVAGGAEARRHVGEARALHPQLAFDAPHRAHGAALAAGFGGSGSLSGPFCPQAPRARASAIQARARIMRRKRSTAPPSPMNESEFHRAVDEVLARIERAAEATEGDRRRPRGRHPHPRVPRRQPDHRQPPGAQPRDLGGRALRRLPLRLEGRRLARHALGRRVLRQPRGNRAPASRRSPAIRLIPGLSRR